MVERRLMPGADDTTFGFSPNVTRVKLAIDAKLASPLV